MEIQRLSSDLQSFGWYWRSGSYEVPDWSVAGDRLDWSPPTCIPVEVVVPRTIRAAHPRLHVRRVRQMPRRSPVVPCYCPDAAWAQQTSAVLPGQIPTGTAGFVLSALNFHSCTSYYFCADICPTRGSPGDKDGCKQPGHGYGTQLPSLSVERSQNYNWECA